MSFLEDDEDIIFQTKKTKEVLEMIEYITAKFYEKFEKIKMEENLLDYIDLEKYTLKLLYDKKEEGISLRISKQNENNIIEKIIEKYEDLDNLRESIKIEYDIEKLEEIYSNIAEIIESEFANYSENLNNKYELSNIAKAMKEDVEEIAVDEYQDINMLQEYIIRAVSNKNIFRVGDPKQSIYGFRNSRPELFVEKEQNISNENKVIYLDKNFRSLENVLEITNNVFSRIMTKETGIIDYNENHYLKKGRYITGEFRLQENSNISDLESLEIYSLSEENIRNKIEFFKPEILLINTKEEEEEKDERKNLEKNLESNLQNNIELASLGDDDNENYDNSDSDDEILEEIEGLEKEAIGIAKRIITLREEYKKIGKRLEYKDIVILLRSVNKRAGRYQEILEKFGIPCYTDTNESFLEIPEVSLICSYLDIIENPLNDINMLAVLRSYFFKMDIDEFTRIKVVEKEITNGQKENNFYESILIYISYIEEKINKNEALKTAEKMVYSKCKKLVEELNRLKKLEEEKGLYEVLKDIIIESRILYST
jgi:ATP-dependent helicase/nuclease subunit A